MNSRQHAIFRTSERILDPMCRQTTCKVCKKATWTGCGQHKNEVLRGIPSNQRCKCTQAEKDAAKGWFAKLLGA